MVNTHRCYNLAEHTHSHSVRSWLSTSMKKILRILLNQEGGKRKRSNLSQLNFKTPQNPKEVSQMARILSMFLAEEIQYVIQA